MGNNKVSILGIPLDLGTQRKGVDMGPNALRYEKIVEKLQRAGLKVSDLGNVQCEFSDTELGNLKLKYLKEIAEVSNISAKKIDQILQKKEKVLALGGDHSISIGTVSGASSFYNGELGLIYIDTHGDLNTEETTETGNIHGMSYAAVLGFGNKSLAGIGRNIKKENALLVGAKDLDLAEEKLIKKENLNVFSIMDLLGEGLNPLFKKIDNLQKKVKNLWVSLDLDAIDKVYAPGVGIPNNGGFTYREIEAVAKYIGKNCNIAGLDIVEYNPIRDIENKTADLAIEIAAKFFGKDYSSYTEYLERHRI